MNPTHFRFCFWSAFALMLSCASNPVTPAPQCDQEAGLSACGSECVRTVNDDRHCGACGAACGTTESCVQSTCYADDCAGADCGRAQVCPADRCVDSACVGVICPMGTGCFEGTCVPSSCALVTCAPGLVCVNQACRDVACQGVICAEARACKLGLCEQGSCGDGLVSSGETDVDCGGACARKCELGRGCGGGADCFSSTCDAGRCEPASTCSNRVKDGQETDVDCGGPCVNPCGVGQGCAQPSDCGSWLCTAQRCGEAPTCTNLLEDPNETDVDCGGAACARRCSLGQGCQLGPDCSTGACVAGACVAATCSDGVRNGAETDRDCGGTCTQKCAPGRACLASTDCQNVACVTGVCAQPTCTDLLTNGTETDLDCGGTCSRKCLAGRTCLAGADCFSSACDGGACTTDPTCSDLVKNQDEVGVDCGGVSCAPCPIGQPCGAPKDCASFFCTGTPKQCTSGFGARIDIAAANSGFVGAGRVNGDIFDDLMILNGLTPGFLLGTPTGVPTAVNYLPSMGCCFLADATFSDISGDGFPDLVVVGGDNTGGAYSWMRTVRSNGNATFQPSVESVLPNGYGNTFGVATGDADGIGGTDVVSPFWAGFNAVVLVGHGNGTGAYSFDSPPGFGNIVQNGAAVVADLGGDATSEVAAYVGGATRIFSRGDAGLSFVGPSIPMGPGYLRAADLNGDGRKDLVGTNGSLLVALNAGNLGFGTPLGYSGANTLEVRDFNGDGKLDVVTLRGANVGFFIGDGSGGFSLGPTLTPGAVTSRVTTGDFNGDGKLDVASGNATTVFVWLGL